MSHKKESIQDGAEFFKHVSRIWKLLYSTEASDKKSFFGQTEERHFDFTFIKSGQVIINNKMFIRIDDKEEWGLSYDKKGLMYQLQQQKKEEERDEPHN